VTERLGIRRLRRGRRAAAGNEVRATTQPGPPMSVTVRDTEARPTLTVRIEPRADEAVTTVKDTGP
jgi:hypothetical protein